MEEGVGSIELTASLSDESGRDVIIPLSVSGTATAGIDYALPNSSSILIRAGELSGNIELILLDDQFVEGAEAFVVSMLPSNEAILSSSADQPTAVSLLIRFVMSLSKRSVVSVLFLVVFPTVLLYSEGTKQVMPNSGANGQLCINKWRK